MTARLAVGVPLLHLVVDVGTLLRVKMIAVSVITIGGIGIVLEVLMIEIGR